MLTVHRYIINMDIFSIVPGDETGVFFCRYFTSVCV